MFTNKRIVFIPVFFRVMRWGMHQEIPSLFKVFADVCHNLNILFNMFKNINTDCHIKGSVSLKPEKVGVVKPNATFFYFILKIVLILAQVIVFYVNRIYCHMVKLTKQKPIILTKTTACIKHIPGSFLIE